MIHILRAVFLLLVLTVAVSAWITGGFLGWFIYYTDWSWLGIALHLSLMLLTHYKFMEYKRMPRLYDCLLSCVVTNAWLVSIIFWTLLYSYLGTIGNTFDKILMVTPHSLNIIIAGCELVWTRQEIKRIHVLWPLSALLLYAAFQIMLKNAFHVPYAYPFFDYMMSASWYVTVLGFVIFSVLIAFFFEINIWIHYFVTRRRSKEQDLDSESHEKH